MFEITGLQNIYFMPEVRDMRLGYYRLSEIIKTQYGRDPYNGDIYMFMSRDRRRVRIFRYENETYYLYEKYYEKGMHFMKVEYDLETKNRTYKLDWKEFVILLECPVRTLLRPAKKVA